MPKVFMLIGVPCAGKSTWIANQDWAKNIPIVSSDYYIEQYASNNNKTYNEVFDEYVSTAIKLMNDQIHEYYTNNIDFIWDQTNLSSKTRKKKLSKLTGYDKIAIVFDIPAPDVLKYRMSNRIGKTISPAIMDSMIANFEMPTHDEGFVEIYKVKNEQVDHI